MKSQSLISQIKIDTLSLLHGKPILVPTAGFSIVPKQLKDISAIGEVAFFKYLQILTGELPIQLENEEEDEVDDCVRYYFLLLLIMKESQPFRDIYIEALNYFIDYKIYYDTEDEILHYIIGGENHLISPEVLEAIRFILCKQHLIEVKEKDNPSNSIAKEILEKQKKAREKVSKIKQNSETTTSIEFSDLVSAVAVQIPGLNIINIWNLTYYTFYNQFHRLRMVEDYDIGLKSIMAGADSKKITLKHWIEHIQTKQE